MFLFGNWDYISLDTVGFAQVGNPQYHKKCDIEKKVISAYYEKTEELNVPKEFEMLAHFTWKRWPHEIHSYWDYVISYDREVIDNMEEEQPELYQKFYDWVNACESVMGDKEELLLELCNKRYRENVPMEIIYKAIDDEQGLKAV